jgi:8-oxo-dGTP pyrophosphatase MutT (NUDIX family)
LGTLALTVKLPTVADLAAALARHPMMNLPALPGRRNHLATGVLVPLVWTATGAVECIATVRSRSLRHHAGEVCFPGGTPAPTDRDLEQTALREAREELGIEEARILGPLSSIPLYTSDYRLRPFVAAVPDRPFTVNEREVAAVLRLSLGRVLGQDHIDAIAWSHEGMSALSPVFEHESGTLMFGATAHAFYELLVVAAPLFDREPPPLTAGRFEWSDVLGPAARGA